MIKFNVKINVDSKKISQNIQAAVDKAQLALDQQVLKDSNFYIPKDTSNLESSGVTYSRLGEGHVGWNTPYARRLYYNPQYNFSKDKNPNAQGLWFEAAKATKGTNWSQTAQTEFDKNF